MTMRKNTFHWLDYNIIVEDQKCWKSWSLIVLWRPTRPSRTNNQRRCPFHYRGLECRSRKSRDTRSKRQIWPWSIEWSRAKVNRVFPRESTGHIQHTLPKKTREDSTYRHHQMVNTEIRLIIFFAAKNGKLYTVSKNKTGSWLWLSLWTSYSQIQT